VSAHVLRVGDVVFAEDDDPEYNCQRVVDITAGPDPVGTVNWADVGAGVNNADYRPLAGLRLRNDPDAVIYLDDAEALDAMIAAEAAAVKAEIAEAERQAEAVERRRRHSEQQQAMERHNRIEGNPLLKALYRKDDDKVGAVLLRGDDFSVPARNVTVVYGMTTAGKTFLTVDLACCLGSGIPWLGLDDIVPEPQDVLFIQLEGDGSQVLDRIKAWEVEHGIDWELEVGGDDYLRPSHIRPRGFDWDDPDIVDQLVELVSYEDVGVVIIDNLDAGRPGSGNLTDADVGRIFAGVLPALCAAGVTVILVAHPDATDDHIAGLSRQANAVEAVIHVKDRKSGRVAILEKTKVAKGRPEVAFRIEDSAHVSEDSGLPVGVVRVGKAATASEPLQTVPEATDSILDDPDEAAMLAVVVANPGISTRRLYGLTPNIKGGQNSRAAVLGRLVRDGYVRYEIVGQSHAHYAVGDDD
jgi:hypothetical protein